MRLINRFAVLALSICLIAPVAGADATSVAADAGISSGVCLWLCDAPLEQLQSLAKDGRILTRVLAPEPQVAALRGRLQESCLYGLVTVTPRPKTSELPMVTTRLARHCRAPGFRPYGHPALRLDGECRIPTAVLIASTRKSVGRPRYRGVRRHPCTG